MAEGGAMKIHVFCLKRFEVFKLPTLAIFVFFKVDLLTEE